MINLGELISKLENQPLNNKVRFDFGDTCINLFCGYTHGELALDFKRYGESPRVFFKGTHLECIIKDVNTVGDLLIISRKQIDKHQTCFEEGTFISTSDSPIHIASYGQKTYTVLKNVKTLGDITYLITESTLVREEL